MGSTPTGHAGAVAVYGDGELPADADLLAPSADDSESTPRRDDMATQHTTAEEE